jgi:hypothetical protein
MSRKFRATLQRNANSLSTSKVLNTMAVSLMMSLPESSGAQQIMMEMKVAFLVLGDIADKAATLSQVMLVSKSNLMPLFFKLILPKKFILNT